MIVAKTLWDFKPILRKSVVRILHKTPVFSHLSSLAWRCDFYTAKRRFYCRSSDPAVKNIIELFLQSQWTNTKKKHKQNLEQPKNQIKISVSFCLNARPSSQKGGERSSPLCSKKVVRVIMIGKDERIKFTVSKLISIVVAEKITRLIEYATNQCLPLILVCSSGCIFTGSRDDAVNEKL
ncbi:hypothetical protein YC2023_109047 [Brassica napus]